MKCPWMIESDRGTLELQKKTQRSSEVHWTSCLDIFSEELSHSKCGRHLWTYAFQKRVTVYRVIYPHLNASSAVSIFNTMRSLFVAAKDWRLGQRHKNLIGNLKDIYSIWSLQPPWLGASLCKATHTGFFGQPGRQSRSDERSSTPAGFVESKCTGGSHKEARFTRDSSSSLQDKSCSSLYHWVVVLKLNSSALLQQKAFSMLFHNHYPTLSHHFESLPPLHPIAEPLHLQGKLSGSFDVKWWNLMGYAQEGGTARSCGLDTSTCESNTETTGDGANFCEKTPAARSPTGIDLSAGRSCGLSTKGCLCPAWPSAKNIKFGNIAWHTMIYISSART